MEELQLGYGFGTECSIVKGHPTGHVSLVKPLDHFLGIIFDFWLNVHMELRESLFVDESKYLEGIKPERGSK